MLIPFIVKVSVLGYFPLYIWLLWLYVLSIMYMTINLKYISQLLVIIFVGVTILYKQAPPPRSKDARRATEDHPTSVQLSIR